MADNKPPIVVGIKQTKREGGYWCIGIIGKRFQGHTNTKIKVKAANKIVKAISLGVFWRLAPSTKQSFYPRNFLLVRCHDCFDFIGQYFSSTGN
jgi:hypothetical protein